MGSYIWICSFHLAMAPMKTLVLLTLCWGMASVQAGIVREADPGEPLTAEDFEYAESAEFQNEIANEEDHDEDGSASLFEGDIEMSDAEQRQALMDRGIPGLREVVRTQKWPKSADGFVRIPYKVPSGLSRKRRAAIAQAVREYDQKTCIRFVPYNNERRRYINIVTNAKGCASPLGMQRSVNNVKFGPNCSWGNLCHEFMHSLGFFHEHTRTDRDKYVTIEWDNIPDDWVHNFYKCNQRGAGCNDLKVGYDYGSIMHYGRQLKGKTAIRSKKIGVSIGQRKRMSRLDIQGIKEYYGC